VSHGDTHLLIDDGISLRRVTAGLKRLGLSPGDLTGVLITHEHSDHISGLKILIKYLDTPIYAPYRVAEGLCSIIPEAAARISCFPAGTEFVLGELSVTSFLTLHDTPESVGYRFNDGRSSLVFVTDIGCVTPAVLSATLGADMAVIEANHDIVMLKKGIYPPHLKRRILSDRGHLSNDDSGSLACRLAGSGTKHIVLAHLSKENNTPPLALETVGGALLRQGASLGGDVTLDASPADDMGKLYIL
jgi:phosphoribosyl 1,2-cyclic phosphodiesterase